MVLPAYDIVQSLFFFLTTLMPSTWIPVTFSFSSTGRKTEKKSKNHLGELSFSAAWATSGDANWNVVEELRFHRRSAALVVWQRCSLLLFLKYFSMNTPSPLPLSQHKLVSLCLFYYGIWNSLYW